MPSSDEESNAASEASGSAGSPREPRPSPPPTRGIGLIAGVATFGLVGLADGLWTLHKAPRGSVGLRLALLVLFHSTAVLLTLGLIFGALEELVIASARRTPVLARF